MQIRVLFELNCWTVLGWENARDKGFHGAIFIGWRQWRVWCWTNQQIMALKRERGLERRRKGDERKEEYLRRYALCLQLLISCRKLTELLGFSLRISSCPVREWDRQEKESLWCFGFWLGLHRKPWSLTDFLLQLLISPGLTWHQLQYAAIPNGMLKGNKRRIRF